MTKLVIRDNPALVIFVGVFQWVEAQIEHGNLLLPQRCCICFWLAAIQNLLSSMEMVRAYRLHKLKLWLLLCLTVRLNRPRIVSVSQTSSSFYRTVCSTLLVYWASTPNHNKCSLGNYTGYWIVGYRYWDWVVIVFRKLNWQKFGRYVHWSKLIGTVGRNTKKNVEYRKFLVLKINGSTLHRLILAYDQLSVLWSAQKNLVSTSKDVSRSNRMACYDKNSLLEFLFWLF